MPEIKCQRCGWVWNYKGKKDVNSEYSTTNCPNCMAKVKLKEQRVEGGGD